MGDRVRRQSFRFFVAAICTLAVTALPRAALAAPRDYDIVYVRQPRFGDTTNTTWPEVAHPASIDPGADLMLLAMGVTATAAAARFSHHCRRTAGFSRRRPGA